MDIDFNIECWYKNGCPLIDINCQKTCHRYLEMNYLINNCGMKHASKYLRPLRSQPDDLEAYKRLQQIKDGAEMFVQNGSNLYIASINLQTGKTTWALKILYKYFDEIWAGNGFKIRGYFLYVPEFLNKMKNFSYKETSEYKKIHNILKTADLVIWDDISSIQLSQADQGILNMYIDKRIMEDKSNIFTGLFDNQDPTYLKTMLGFKLASRLNSVQQIVLQGQSIKK